MKTVRARYSIQDMAVDSTPTPPLRRPRLACWLCAVLAFGLLAPQAFPQQGGVEQLEETLRERTQARRAAADLRWKESGPAYLAKPGEESMAPLLELAPEVQEPVLRALRAELAREKPEDSKVDALIAVLEQCANPSGADRLAAMLDRLPAGPKLRAIALLGDKGGPRSIRELEARLEQDQGDLRVAALMSLLRKGQGARCADWLAQVDLSRLSSRHRQDVVELLAKRELPADFRLPENWLRMREPAELGAIFEFLATHPDENLEEFALDFTLDRNRPLQLRLASLKVVEHGMVELKWRDAKRRLGALLRAGESDPLEEHAAWALHRSGDKAGARYLLDGPEERVKRDRNDWRAHLELGKLQVELSEFRDGYRSFEDAIRLADISRGRFRAEEWLYAARAAAGAGKEKDAGEWLSRTRMSPSELAPYRKLPEFADLLDQEPFDRLFGNP